jgi:predicted XRE-type DNA-binding protein
MFDSLEVYVKNEIKDIYSKIDILSEEREDKETKISTEVDKLSTKLNKHKEESHNSTREIRQQLLEQFKGLSEDIQKQSADIRNVVSSEVDNLRDKKTDRMNLAALLTDMALQLRGETSKKLETKDS